MRAGLTINLLFPIKDEPSAKLMSLKAEWLCAAGVIDVVEKRIILERAATIAGATARVAPLARNLKSNPQTNKSTDAAKQY